LQGTGEEDDYKAAQSDLVRVMLNIAYLKADDTKKQAVGPQSNADTPNDDSAKATDTKDEYDTNQMIAKWKEG
jgi:hypothetical protein